MFECSPEGRRQEPIVCPTQRAEEKEEKELLVG